MNRGLIGLYGLTALLPLAIEVPSIARDSLDDRVGGTRVRVSAGAGYYAFIARGCEGKVLDHVPVHFRDAGFSVDHEFAAQRLAIGVRGGWLEDEIGSQNGAFFDVPIDATVANRYLNPHLAFEDPRLGIGAGYVYHEHEFITAGEGAREQRSHPTNDFSYHMRIGTERKHFIVSWMESVPLASGGGYLTLGLGGRAVGGRVELFVGLSAGGPYEGGAPMIHAGWRVTPRWIVDVTGRARGSGGQAATGISVGVEYRALAARRRVDPTRE